MVSWATEDFGDNANRKGVAREEDGEQVRQGEKAAGSVGVERRRRDTLLIFCPSSMGGRSVLQEQRWNNQGQAVQVWKVRVRETYP